nr:integrase, catalytic region, zinc finger, CCHC-type, peptidase aspartic, catalytic [Tanacetum cinerariifolium]
MSRDVITVGSTMMIPLLYRGKYSQWRERFMNYLEEQMDGEAMINSIQNGDQPLPVIDQVSTSAAEEKKTRKIYRLVRSLLIQGLPNDIYSLIDSNKTAKDLWDALERQMCGFEYGEQDRKAVILYEYETFKSIEGEQFFDTYLCYLQLINDLKKCGYKKDNCELNYKFLNNPQQEWKQYATLMRQTKNLMYININALYNILKQNQGDVNDALGYKKKAVVITSDPLALVAEKTKVNKRKEKVVVSSDSKGSEFVNSDDKKVEKKDDEKKRDMSKVKCYNCRKEGHFAKDCKKAEVKDYNYYKTKMLLAKKDSDEQVHLAEDQAWMESSSDSDKEINANIVFMAQIEKKRIEKANQQSKDFKNQNKDLQEKYDVLINHVNTFKEQNNEFNEQIKVLNEKNADLLDQMKVLKDQLQVKYVMIDTHVECHEKYAKLEEERYEYMIRYSDLFDNDKQHRKQIADQEVLFNKMSVELVELDKHVRDLKNTVLEKDFKISKLKESKDLRPSLYDEKVIGLGYTLMFLTHSDEALEIEKFKRSRENKIKFAYDYGNLNASYVTEKINFLDDYFQEIINPDFEKIDSPFQQTSSLKPYVPNVILEKIIIDLEDEVVSLLEKEKANLKTIESLKSKGFELSENEISETKNQSENDCQVVEKECDNVENPNVIAPGMFKLRVSQSVSLISMSKTSCESKNVESKLKRKRRKRKSSKQNDKQVNNDVSRANSDFVHFSDLDTFSSVRRSKNSGIIWKKKGSSNTSNVDLSSVSNSKLNKDVKRYSRKDLLSFNNSHLGETSSAYVCNDAMNHMTGNRALLTNFVEKFFGTVRFGNNDFAVIVGYGDVVIGSMTIKKVYYVEGLGHNLFSVGQFCDKGLEVAFRKSTCFVQNEDGVDLLIDDRSSNLYTIALNEVASNSLTCILAKASSSQS